MSKKQKVWVKGYTKRDGTKVKGYWRRKSISYSQTKMSTAREKFQEHMLETHPDLKDNSNIVYRFANEDWEENMNRSDVIGIDTKDRTRKPPVVSKLPKKPKPGQCITYKGKKMVYDPKLNRFKQYH